MQEAPNLPPSSPRSSATASRGGNRVTDRILPPQERAPRQSFIKRAIFPYFERVTASGTALGRIFNEDDIRVRLLRAGFPMGLKASTFRVIKLTGILLGALLFALYFPVLNRIFGPNFGFTMPNWFSAVLGGDGRVLRVPSARRLAGHSNLETPERDSTDAARHDRFDFDFGRGRIGFDDGDQAHFGAVSPTRYRKSFCALCRKFNWALTNRRRCAIWRAASIRTI